MNDGNGGSQMYRQEYGQWRGGFNDFGWYNLKNGLNEELRGDNWNQSGKFIENTEGIFNDYSSRSPMSQSQISG